MITARTIVGSREKVAKEISEMPGEVVEAIVFVEQGDAAIAVESGSIFAEMVTHEVDVSNVDYSRDSVYLPPEAE